MMELVEANWLFLLVALLIGIAVAWFVFNATRKTTITRDETATDEPKAAARNQALIDSEPVARREPASEPPPAPMGVAGAGTAVAAAAQDAKEKRAEAAPVPAPAPATGATTEDLTRIKGVGPKLAARLQELGVTSLDQIAAWKDADIDRIDPQLGRFEGRIRRDDWVTQAKLLSENDTAAYESRFGKL